VEEQKRGKRRLITVLAGGVGAAKFLQGLIRVIDPSEITVIVNTGDDEEFHGLHVSPDLDTIMYTLASIVDETKGWGIEGDSFRCLELLKIYGEESWFQLGDKDFATHILRTKLLDEKCSLSEITRILSDTLGIRSKIIPMSDDRVSTIVRVKEGYMRFQDYFVKRANRDEIHEVRFDGIEKAIPAPQVIDSIMNSTGVIIAPSNPIVSIGTILSVKGVRNALQRTKAPAIAISPIIGGTTIKGPADRMMKGLGIEASAYGVAMLYSDFLDCMVIDEIDEPLRDRIEEQGIAVRVTDTILRDLHKKEELARFILAIIADS
jgi:LPPG:FO 2-phospho-L-lactate transferase